MILTLDVGNSQIFGGVFEDGELTLRFRRAAQPSLSSDELVPWCTTRDLGQ